MLAKHLKPRLAKYFDRLIDKPRWRHFYNLLDSSADREGFFFVQIGANDGLVHDPIRRYVLEYDWRGILVEPAPYYFNKLVDNYRDCGNLAFENAAISNRDGTRPFYRIREGITHLPRWCEGIGSLDLAVLLKHKWIIPNIEEYIVEENVTCVALTSLFEKHQVNTIDLLLIDTEGYDYEVLKQIDFKMFKPSIIVFEHKHLSRSDRSAARKYLLNHEYKLKRYLGNTLAYTTLRS